MPTDEHAREAPTPPVGQPPRSDGHLSPAGDRGTATAEPPAAGHVTAAAVPGQRKLRPWWVKVAFGLAGLVVLVLGVKWLIFALNTVSTDDAYVNGHVTFVAARVPGQVTKVLVDDNNRVRQGDLLVQLDKEPYTIQVDLKQAAVDIAKTNVQLAQDKVRGIVAQARSNRFRLEHTIEDVNNQLALLQAKVAQLKVEKANLVFATSDYARIEALVGKGAVSTQDFDKARAALDVAKNRVAAAQQDIQQVRASLGLPINVDDPLDVPADLDQTFSTVRQALNDLLASVAPLNVHPTSYMLTPKQIIEEFYKRDPHGDLDKIYAQLMENAPAIKQANAQLEQAEADLDQANLNLRYCDVFAEIGGVITRRNVNPGNNVQAGQGLMAIRSLTEIWVDANFKETQLANLRIGQQVEARRRHVWPAPAVRGADHRLYDGDRFDLVAAAGAECDGQLHQGRAAIAGAHRAGRITTPTKSRCSSACRSCRMSCSRSRPLARMRGRCCNRISSRRRRPKRRKTSGRIDGASSMSTAALAVPAARPAINPWIVAAVVVVPTFMEVLDTTIANVALRYIAGGLSAAVVDGEWVITSYLAANAIILPISGWLSAHLGRRNYFLLSIARLHARLGAVRHGDQPGSRSFCSACCRVWPAAGLQPSSQGVLLDSFPPEKQGAAMTLFGVAALIGPVVGPTLGGYLTDNYNWRWIFYINMPVGRLPSWRRYWLLDDPQYLKEEREELAAKPLNFDYIGLGLLAICLSCWEVMLSKGQQWDWFGDPFWRVQTLVIGFVGSLALLVFRELRIANPVVDFRPLAERNLALTSIIIFCAYGVLYAASTSLPGLLQSLFGYDAFSSGLVMSPSGLRLDVHVDHRAARCWAAESTHGG